MHLFRTNRERSNETKSRSCTQQSRQCQFQAHTPWDWNSWIPLILRLDIHRRYQRCCEFRNDHEVGMLSNRSPERSLPGGIAVAARLLSVRRLPCSHVNYIMHVQECERECVLEWCGNEWWSVGKWIFEMKRGIWVICN